MPMMSLFVPFLADVSWESVSSNAALGLAVAALWRRTVVLEDRLHDDAVASLTAIRDAAEVSDKLLERMEKILPLVEAHEDLIGLQEDLRRVIALLPRTASSVAAKPNAEATG